MALRSKAALLLLGYFGWGAAAVVAISADESALATLWSRHQQSPDKHSAVIEACAQFEKSYPQSPFLAVSRGLAAWHQLRADSPAAAAPLLESLLSTSAEPLPKAGDDLARHWLTRLDREKVRAALRQYYNAHILFPDSLEQLGPGPAWPRADRWGDSWRYQPARLKHVTGLSKQTYELESRRLAANSDLATALAVPYASGIKLKPVRIEGQSVATFTIEGRSVLLSAGASLGNTTFVYLGEQFLILSDGDHWLLTPRPGGTAN